MCHGVRRHQVPRRGGRGSVMSHLQWGAGGASAGRYLFSFNRNILEHLEKVTETTLSLCECVSQGFKMIN